MLAAFTELKNAQKVKKFLIKNNLLNLNYRPLRELNHLYFPITKRKKVPLAKIIDTDFEFEKKQEKETIESLLKSKLTKKQLSLIPRSQEIVGSIMILEVPEELTKKEIPIAQAYLELNKNITTIVKKTKIHSGVFRTRKVKILAGKRTKETIHHENGIKIKLHLEKTYYSARSGNERLRLSKKIKKGENVLVMFSGAAPFPLVFGKNSPAKKITAIELNPAAHQYALENVKINKLEEKIRIINGDVREIVPKLREKFDRIAMPLPKTGEQFLDLALKKSKPKGIIHLYSFLNEKEINQEAKRIKQLCRSLKNPVRVTNKIKCGQFSPGTFRICFDLKKEK